MSITLLELRTQARQRADMEKSQFVKDAELNNYINNSIAELYDLISDAYGSDYFVTSSALSIVAGTKQYALPATFYELKAVDLNIGGSEYIDVPKFNFAERNKYSNFGPWQFYKNTNVRYRLIGSTIYFSPTPSQNADAVLWFVPLATKLVDDDDTLDDLNGYAEYVIIDAAIKMLQKQDDDVSVLAAQKSFIIERIKTKTMNRDAGHPSSVTDVYNDGDYND